MIQMTTTQNVKLLTTYARWMLYAVKQIKHAATFPRVARRLKLNPEGNAKSNSPEMKTRKAIFRKYKQWHTFYDYLPEWK
ncbi:hypothetical protein VNO77_12286 [Canavalia gladiata]|uniref:Uncharacterized protein n=1 Tax=Canavalia gladiata TaxID=3824 RepID=A0AAN9LWN3_CANGL